jgi:hypothetical protein
MLVGVDSKTIFIVTVISLVIISMESFGKIIGSGIMITIFKSLFKVTTKIGGKTVDIVDKAVDKVDDIKVTATEDDE